MKKFATIVVFLILISLVSAVCLAEDEFTLRSGILFGDTIEDILEKETTLTRQDDDSNWFDGRIAGYDNASAGFYFDDDGKLVSMDYRFGTKVCKSRDDMNSVYKELYQSLNRKYGKPIGNTGGSCELITGPAFENMAVMVYLLGSLDGYDGDFTDYDEWIVDSENGHVKIDMISYYYRDDSYNYSFYVDVSYHFYTDEEYDNAVKEKQGKREEVDNDM